MGWLLRSRVEGGDPAFATINAGVPTARTAAAAGVDRIFGIVHPKT
jgi:hypothetical protein